nr:reverse transcriptase domain-containing protein [Tanacetum cinerariifolium]
MLENNREQVQRTLPGNTITNPKEELKGITTRSSVAYQGPKTPSPSKQGTKPVVATVSAPMPNLKPFIPYPSRLDNEKRRDQANEQIKKFYEIFKEMSFGISFTDALILMPKFASTLKDLIGNKEKLSEMARTTMNEHCSAVILNKLPRKLGDPGKFLIPCEFSEMDECLALADLGACINLMPLSVWEGLSLPELTPTCMTLKLTDRSVSKPIGIAKDVSFKVGVFHFPAEFVVFDFEPDPRVPLILGRCFLKTSRALIDVHKGKLTLRIGNEAITYNLEQTMRYSANYNQMTTKKLMSSNQHANSILKSDFLLFGKVDAFFGLEDDPDSPKVNPFYYDLKGDILLLEAILNSEPSPPLPNQEQNLPSFKEELKAYEAQTVKSSIDEPPEVELKDLPQHLEYAFLEGDNKLSVIIAKELGSEEKAALIKVLKSYKRAIAWKLSDIHEADQRSPAHMARLLTDACLSACAMLRALFKGVKGNQEKDKIRTKTDKNGKRGEAGKSQKQLQSRKKEKLKKMQKEGPKVQSPTSYIKERRKKGLNLQLLQSTKRGTISAKFPVIHPPPQETSIELLYNQENMINSVQTFLRKFSRYSFFETPKVLLLAWDRVVEIKDALGTKKYKPKDLQELFRKLSNDVQNINEELAEYINTPGWNRPAFYDDDDDDDDVDYAIAIAPVLSIEEPVDFLNMGDEHLDTISETESDEVIKSTVEDLIPIPSESEGIPEHKCDVPFHDNSPPLDVSKDQIEDLSDSNDEFSLINDDSFSIDNIDYVEASPYDSEVVSLEAAEIVISEVEEIEDDNLREKLLNSSSTSPKSFLEETNTFHNSLPEFENFYFDLEEISSGSTTDSDISLSNYEFFYFDDDHIEEISGGSTTTHSDVSLSEYDLFIFDLANDQFPPTDRSNFANEEFVDELAHIISPPKYDCFYFWNLPDPGELISILNSKIRENLSTTGVNLPIEDDHSLLLAYVVWIFLAYLTYPVIPPYLYPFRNEDTIFDPGITINHFYSFKPGLSHRCGSFKKFNTHRSHLNEWPMIINERTLLSGMFFCSISIPLDQLKYGGIGSSIGTLNKRFVGGTPCLSVVKFFST